MAGISSCQDSSEIDINEQSKLVVDQQRFDMVWMELQSTPLPSDPFELKNISYSGTELMVDVAYSGGCENHEFELVWPEAITMIYPPRFTVILNHDSNDDYCEAYLSETLIFDLSQNDLGLTRDIIKVMDLTILNGSNPDESLKLNP